MPLLPLLLFHVRQQLPQATSLARHASMALRMKGVAMLLMLMPRTVEAGCAGPTLLWPTKH